MTGGVSLAVWMGGVTHEVNRLLRRAKSTHEDVSVYGKVLDLTETEARVDVITGSSAGGLNGALLAMAMAHESDLESLREVWMDQGSLDLLLREASDGDPPSLLQGNDRFLPEIRKALDGLRNNAGAPTAGAPKTPIHLIITATLLEGQRRGWSDSFGSVIRELDHRAEFTFRRGSAPHHREGCSHQLVDGAHDDFAHEETVDRLALAARSSASFPGAFEPSFCPVGSRSGERPDMVCHASFDESRWTIDGGVLVNKPLGPALRAIVSQPASQQVRRVLAYVVPDPGEIAQGVPDQPKETPSVGRVLLDSLVRLPRNESIAAELEQLEEHNRRVLDVRRDRERWAELGSTEIERLGEASYGAYREQKVERQVQRAIKQATDAAARARRDEERARYSDAPMRDAERFRSALRGALTERLVVATGGKELAGGSFDTEALGHTVSTVTELLTRPLRYTSPSTDSEVRGRLLDAKRQLDELLPPQPEGPPETRGTIPPPPAVMDEDRIHDWAERVADRVAESDRHGVDGRAQRVASLLVQAAPDIRLACAATSAFWADEAARSRELLDALVGGDEEADVVSKTRQRLLALDAVQTTLGSNRPEVEQVVELLQVSADTANGFDGRTQPREKLTGIQLGHFGAFYKSAWRANDWLWGRLDGAQRLAQVLVDPWRLRQLDLDPDHVLNELEHMVLGPRGTELRAALTETRMPRAWNRAELRQELAFLEDSTSPLPESLPLAAQAVARRLQIDILVEELPKLADAIRADEHDGAHTTSSAAALASALRAGAPLSPERAIHLFRASKVGTERLAEEAATDLFAATTSKAAAVASALVTGKANPFARLRRLLTPLRGLALVLYVLARNATEGGRVGRTLVPTLCGVGGALLALALVTREPAPIFLLLGLTLLGAGLILAALRQRLLVGLTVSALVVALPLIVGLWLGLRPQVGDVVGVLVVAAGVAGGLLLGVVGRGTKRQAKL
jgi:predicted acylesterase/phospholipase RssA